MELSFNVIAFTFSDQRLMQALSLNLGAWLLKEVVILLHFTILKAMPFNSRNTLNGVIIFFSTLLIILNNFK